jgi:NAD(P)-dependent dehydrogenase (short-subunit alcohol dehydrogenase family)
MASATQRIAVITGASSGIGFETAKALAREGWRVIALGRDDHRIAQSKAGLAEAGHSAEWLQADFAALSDVRRVAADIAAITDRVDLLVNNAGLLLDGRQETTDGMEKTFQVNHIAAFHLTNLLIKALAASKAPHVITVSSIGHSMIEDIRWDDIMLEREFRAVDAYAQSKLANVLFTRELASRAANRNIVASAVHPGMVASRFPDGADEHTRQYYAEAERRGTALTSEQGADTIVWLAADRERALPSGGYFFERKRVDPSLAAQDDKSARRLWEISARLVESDG